MAELLYYYIYFSRHVIQKEAVFLIQDRRKLVSADACNISMWKLSKNLNVYTV